jgi:hypothetical protein
VSRTQNSANPYVVPEYAQRSAFVFGLRGRNPRFWRTLNEVWREGGDLHKWMRETGVVDQWLIDFVTATIDLWNRDPDGPNACLQIGSCWFGFPALTGSEVSDFQPVFDRPFPISTAPDDLREQLSGASFGRFSAISRESQHDGWAETLEGLRKRMTDQFESQLTDYVRSIRSAYGYQATAWTFQHAGWTALAFGGLSYAEIARSGFSDGAESGPCKRRSNGGGPICS